MRRVDEGVRRGIEHRAEELEAAGQRINRRALSREFGVSPQTVARVLDGPSARRSAEVDSAEVVGGGLLVGLGLLGLAVWAIRTAGKRLQSTKRPSGHKQDRGSRPMGSLSLKEPNQPGMAGRAELRWGARPVDQGRWIAERSCVDAR
jgi:hypothetical protein